MNNQKNVFKSHLEQVSQTAASPVVFSDPKQQVYGIPTYDALFKYVLDSNEVRPSFFHAMIPDLNIVSSERIDEHMNPLQELQALRHFLHNTETDHVVTTLKEQEGIEIHYKDFKQTHQDHPKATAFLLDVLNHFDDIKKSFPKRRYDGTMDFVCKLDNNDFVMVEMQVLPYDYWDRRALAYVAALYGKQMREGSKWKDIKKVIGINVLGGGKDHEKHWGDTPSQYMRHYKMQEQIYPEKRYIDGIEIFQYALENTPKDLANKEQQDWFLFLKNASHMSEAEVDQTITTPAVKAAFNRAKLNELPDRVKEMYQMEDNQYQQYSIHTQEQIDKGKAEGKAEGIEIGKAEGKDEAKREIAMKMILKNKDDDEIMEFSGLSATELVDLRRSL